MSPDEPASPERLDAQFNQIVQRSYGTDAPQWPAAAVPPSHPAPQYPIPQYPIPQYPIPQYPIPQYPMPQYPMPQYPMPQYPMPQYPMPPRKPRRTGRIVALVTSLTAVMCLVGLAFAASVLNVMPRDKQTDPPSESEIVADKVRTALDKQRSALLAGDETGYLSILDPGIDATDKEAIDRQFRSLRAMKVADWSDRVMTSTDLPDSDLWEVDLISSACFVVIPCPEGQATSSTKWRITESLARLADWDVGRHPHPWQANELVAKVGERVIAATTKPFEKELGNVLKAAEDAAKVADRFAHNKPPARYVVYYAGEKEWKTWFLTKPPDWSAGVAVDVSDDRYEVVLNAAEMNDLMPLYLRHELTHASSMPGRVDSGEKYWYLMEGIAELAAMDGAPARDHPGVRNVPVALAASGSDGFQLEAPGSDAKEEVVDGSYAIAFLAARCMAERFGEKKFVEFFHEVLHEDKPEEKASDEVFGMDWAALSRDCLEYVRSTAE